jgi:hypothetical protein
MKKLAAILILAGGMALYGQVCRARDRRQTGIVS